MDVLSQEAQILAHLRAGNTLTAIEALRRFGCFRLAARVLDLKEEGHEIKSTIIEVNGKRVAQYALSH